ncbi:MAG: hypothetical protein JWP45_661 [Mucilaginibacter sp.]|nr:hypothetical protein [Mucilaginibacter sp.]
MKRNLIPILFAACAALLAGCKEDAVQVPQDKIIKLTITSDTADLKADGLSPIRLQATIPANTVDGARNVTFTASAALGTFNGSTGAASNVVTASPDGLASTSLVAGKVPGTYYISAQITNSGIVYKTNDMAITLHPLSISDELSLTADNLSPVADGLSIVNLSVSAKYLTQASVKLTTTLGSFPLSSDPKNFPVILDSKGNGAAVFQMDNQLLPHIIVAAFSDGTNVSVTLNPIISRPDDLLVDASSLLYNTDGSAVTITAYLRKFAPNAKVTQGIAPGYTAYQLIGVVKKSVGRFSGLSNAVSDASGNIPAVSFFADSGDIDTTQDVLIDVTAPKTSTTNFTVTIHLKKKT